MIGKWLGLSFATLLAGCATTMAPDDRTAAGSLLSERVKQLTRGTAWKQVAAIPAQFDTHHPQGMVKIGDTIFVSSVEVTVPTKRFTQPTDSFDRDPGQGVGHLFKFTMEGKLVARSRSVFRELVDDCRDRIEVVVRFLALLELYRQGKVEVRQAGPLGEIEVEWRQADGEVP